MFAGPSKQSWSACMSCRTLNISTSPPSLGAEGVLVVVQFLGCLNACLVQPVISVERSVFYRERAAGLSDVGYSCLLLMSFPSLPF